MKYFEYKKIDFFNVSVVINDFWLKNNIFEKSIENRKNNPLFLFYEGPPSVNGIPGIHHVLSRTIKDVFCRYKTLKGYLVIRKAGWDSHGLPVELYVEKFLKIKKENIGINISIEEYNRECCLSVMKYKSKWEYLTYIMGYWLDMNDYYITFDNFYIESLWYIIKKLHEKGLVYKDYSV